MALTKKQFYHYLPLLLVLIIYTVGVVGMHLDQTHSLTTSLTPINLLFCLIIWGIGYYRQSYHHWLSITIIVLLGWLIEVAGVHYTWIFGAYHYGDLLGPGLFGVPFLMGVNWLFMVSGSCEIVKKIKMPTWARIIAASFLMVGFDLVMEYVAIAMGFWVWDSPDVPLRNFFSWGIFAIILNTIYLAKHKTTTNNLAVLLFVVQLLFFCFMRWSVFK